MPRPALSPSDLPADPVEDRFRSSLPTGPCSAPALFQIVRAVEVGDPRRRAMLLRSGLFATGGLPPSSQRRGHPSPRLQTIISHLDLLLAAFGYPCRGWHVTPRMPVCPRDLRRGIDPLMTTTVIDHRVTPPRARIGDDAPAHPGQRFPAVDRSPITGESVSIEKSPSDDAFAGATQGQCALTDRVERGCVPSAPSPVFLPPLPLWSVWFYRAMSFLTAASPRVPAIGTPAAALIFIGRSARAVVPVKGVAHPENLVPARVIAFDKTGALTAAFEPGSEHPPAGATVAGAESQERKHLPATVLEQAPGPGIHARAGQRRITTRRSSILKSLHNTTAARAVVVGQRYAQPLPLDKPGQDRPVSMVNDAPSTPRPHAAAYPLAAAPVPASRCEPKPVQAAVEPAKRIAPLPTGLGTPHHPVTPPAARSPAVLRAGADPRLRL